MTNDTIYAADTIDTAELKVPVRQEPANLDHLSEWEIARMTSKTLS